MRSVFGSDDPSEKSTAKSIARTSLAFYIRDELRAAMRARRRSQFGWWLACRSGRDAGLAGSTRELVRVLLHRGETTWQQRRRRPLAKEARRPAAHRRARALVHARGTRQHARPRVVSAGSSLRDKTEKPARAGFFACGVDHLEYRALANSTIRAISAGYSSPAFWAERANSLFCSR